MKIDFTLFPVYYVEFRCTLLKYLFHILRTFELGRNKIPMSYIITTVIAIIIHLKCTREFLKAFNSFSHIFSVFFFFEVLTITNKGEKKNKTIKQKKKYNKRNCSTRY